VHPEPLGRRRRPEGVPHKARGNRGLGNRCLHIPSAMTTIGLKYRFICNGTSNQVLKLPTTTNTLVAKLNAPLYRAYLLKEQPRMVFHVGYEEALRSRASNPTTYPRAKNSVFALRCRPRAIECAVDEVAGRVLRKANCSATEVTCARVPQVCCRLRGVQQTPEHERRNGQCWRQDRDRLDRLNDSPPCSTHGRHPHKDVGCKTICSSSPAWRLPDSRWRKACLPHEVLPRVPRRPSIRTQSAAGFRSAWRLPSERKQHPQGRRPGFAAD